MAARRAQPLLSRSGPESAGAGQSRMLEDLLARFTEAPRACNRCYVGKEGEIKARDGNGIRERMLSNEQRRGCACGWRECRQHEAGNREGSLACVFHAGK